MYGSIYLFRLAIRSSATFNNTEELFFLNIFVIHQQ